MKFYTSDLHFGHNNILRFENRPFKSVEEMDETIIANWNRKVAKGDEVYILGDFAFADGTRANELAERLNGRKFLVKGNHDHYFLSDKRFNKDNFIWIKDYASIKDGEQALILFHYPIAVWDRQHHGSLHLFGHIHSNASTMHPLTLKLDNAYNVGVDVWNYEPVTLEEILKGKKK